MRYKPGGRKPPRKTKARSANKQKTVRRAGTENFTTTLSCKNCGPQIFALTFALGSYTDIVEATCTRCGQTLTADDVTRQRDEREKNTRTELLKRRS